MAIGGTAAHAAEFESFQASDGSLVPYLLVLPGASSTTCKTKNFLPYLTMVKDNPPRSL